MNRLFTTVLIILAVFIASCTSHPKSDLIDNNIRGNVMMISDSSFRAVEKEMSIVKAQYTGYTHTTYDLKGNKLNSYHFGPSERMEYERICYIMYYHSNPNWTSYFYELGPDGCVKEQGSIYCNPDKFEKTMDLNTRSSEGRSRFYLYYDNKGHLRKLKRGDIIFTYKYDSKGNRTEMNLDTPDGILKGKTTYEYNKFDEEGNWLERIEYPDNGPPTIIQREISYYSKN